MSLVDKEPDEVVGLEGGGGADGVDVTVTWAVSLAVMVSPFCVCPDALIVFVKLAVTPVTEQM